MRRYGDCFSRESRQKKLCSFLCVCVFFCVCIKRKESQAKRLVAVVSNLVNDRKAERKREIVAMVEGEEMFNKILLGRIQ